MKQVHQDQVKAFVGKVPDRILAHISRLRIIKWSEFVTDIYDIEFLVHLQYLPLDGAHQEVFMTDI